MLPDDHVLCNARPSPCQSGCGFGLLSADRMLRYAAPYGDSSRQCMLPDQLLRYERSAGSDEDGRTTEGWRLIRKFEATN